MSYSATITDLHDPDAMPMWESFDHADPDAALQAAHTYITPFNPPTASSTKDTAST
ncbi:hypothetical protein [Mycolicibacter arupensis]|jgi:hypothetical protein|uniref:hypothetical protein n=1 Tax=Mycolicibacter arupensis TaxID=342002 RepID=UPI0023F36308|nr:hypothetical protein [Mycolicibacter arupensis]